MANRYIQDEEIEEMIEFLQTSSAGIVIVSNLTAMLDELLKLREKVRKDA
jgi:collagenase-like PrtC family protease